MNHENDINELKELIASADGPALAELFGETQRLRRARLIRTPSAKIPP